MPKIKKAFIMALILTLLVIIIDQLTKYIVLNKLTPYDPMFLLPILNFTLAFNTGAAFSFLATAGGWQTIFFPIFVIIVSVGLLVWLYRLKEDEKLQRMSVALILGGALGNLCDRFRLGQVVDFIQVHWHSYYFPVFNVADSAITVGAFLLLMDVFFLQAKN